MKKTIIRKTRLRRPKQGKKPRNKLEQGVWDLLEDNNIDFGYEDRRLDYTLHHIYTPDFVLKNGVIIETKGYFRVEDKRKMRGVKEAHPHLDIRIVFSPAKTISAQKQLAKNIKWCNRWGFPYAEADNIPEDWYKG